MSLNKAFSPGCVWWCLWPSSGEPWFGARQSDFAQQPAGTRAPSTPERSWTAKRESGVETASRSLLH